jgi:hypothetical protein
MCNQKPPKGSDDTSEGGPQRMTVDHVRRAAGRGPEVTDPVLMAKAWDEPATPDLNATSATNSSAEIRPAPESFSSRPLRYSAS